MSDDKNDQLRRSAAEMMAQAGTLKSDIDSLTYTAIPGVERKVETVRVDVEQGNPRRLSLAVLKRRLDEAIAAVVSLRDNTVPRLAARATTIERGIAELKATHADAVTSMMVSGNQLIATRASGDIHVVDLPAPGTDGDAVLLRARVNKASDFEAKVLDMPGVFVHVGDTAPAWPPTPCDGYYVTLHQGSPSNVPVVLPEARRGVEFHLANNMRHGYVTLITAAGEETHVLPGEFVFMTRGVDRWVTLSHKRID